MRVLVIGAGVFGVWSAKFLADAGHHVTIVDAYGPANGRSSSADHSRVIRCGYGRDEVYSRWAHAAWADWEWLSTAARQALLTRTCALFLAESDHAYVRDTYDTLTRLGVPVESLTPDDVRARFPSITQAPLEVAVYEPGAGVLRARAAVQALLDILVRDDAASYRRAFVESVDEQEHALRVTVNAGDVLHADAYVFACGAWLPKLFPQAIGGRIRATRQEVLYFGVPFGSVDFSIEKLPVWIDFAAGLYGVPDLDGRGFKVGVDRHGSVVDPDALERVIDPDVVQSTRAWIGRRFPGLRGAPLLEGRVCQYENSSSGDFIIDRHPQWPHCWIVGGGSGHGFKHGPSVGRHVAALVSGAATVIARFALAGKATVAARAVF